MEIAPLIARAVGSLGHLGYLTTSTGGVAYSTTGAERFRSVCVWPKNCK